MRDVYAVLRQKEIEQSSLKNEVEALRIVARRSVMTEYKWHEVYKAALLETDWSKIEERITAAEAALTSEEARVRFEPRRGA
jgi:hypothetical protein